MNTPESERCQCRIIHQGRVDKARKTALSESEIEKIANMFRLLSDPTRLRIILALEHEEMCVCDLAAFLGISESSASHQLRTLRQSGLVANRRQGPILYYRLADNHIHEVTTPAINHFQE